ncbi:MAG: alpha/beta hydrolase [Candidatus Heimdallarchaeota archaeon]|nr:alpha/beta hydrolase [Candidatus Heimdallarchaeota archaeon]
MSIKKNIITKLPDSWQDRILARVIASNEWKRIPTFQMLFESFVLMGGARDDITTVFTNANDLNTDFYKVAREQAKEREQIAAKEVNPSNKRIEYQKALLLYFLADWVISEESLFRENYSDLLRVSEIIDSLGTIPTKKVYLEWEEGHIACRLRIPINQNNGQFPLMVLVQGNDTVKETLLFVEDKLIDQNIAVLNVDQPGWGESLMSGNHYVISMIYDADKITNEIFKFLATVERIDINRVGVFGFSGGGTMATILAAADQRFKIMVSYGGAIYDLGKAIKGLPAMQKRQLLKHYGTSKNQLKKLIPAFNYDRILPQIQCDCLLIHGEKDTLAPVETIHKAAELISGPVEKRIVPGGNHMCSDTMMEIQIPFMISWIKKKI